MRTPAGPFALILATLLAAATPAAAAQHVPAQYSADDDDEDREPVQRVARRGRLDVDVWINKDEGGIYRPGESMRVYFRTTGDAHVLVFNVDTEGYIHLIYPYGPEDTPMADGGRAYRIPARSDPYDLVADGPPGIEYVVAVASPYPFRDLPWYLSADRDGERPYDEDDDDVESGQIQGDPYVGIDRIIRRIAPPGREDQIATNETYFYIGRRVEYPRYVCADCHYHPFYFDPYRNACSVFEIRVDATWAHYAPIRWGSVRPRYSYRVRAQAPTRYRQWKQQWSSLDGRTTLRTRFLSERDVRYRRERGPVTRPARPDFRDLRRYREGRIWRGRDEILRLRQNRERVEEERARPWWQRGERRAPQEQRERERGQRPPVRERSTPPREERREERRWEGRDRAREERLERQQQKERERLERQGRQEREQQKERERVERQERQERERQDREARERREREERDKADRDRDREDRGRGWWNRGDRRR